MLTRRELILSGAAVAATGAWALEHRRRARVSDSNAALSDANAALKERNDRLVARNHHLEQRIGRRIPERVTLACILRNQGRGWYIMDDRNHRPDNVARIEQTPDHIILHYTFTAKQVVSLLVAPDDDFAGVYSAGASAGLDHAVIKFRNANGEQVAPHRIVAPRGNFFVRGEMLVLKQA